MDPKRCFVNKKISSYFIILDRYVALTDGYRRGGEEKFYILVTLAEDQMSVNID